MLPEFWGAVAVISLGFHSLDINQFIIGIKYALPLSANMFTVKELWLYVPSTLDI